ncbi:MAG: zinc transporter ZupT [Candidatus Lokiarchaeota archaeon]|nr:zinc transporter ZupT [Candidatus Lokiarchaeota archaeon]
MDFVLEDFLFAFFLSLLAGLSTTIGSVIAFIVKKPNPKFISFVMGFSAGVMIFISFVELLLNSISSIGYQLGVLFFFLGMGIMFLIDVIVSHKYEFEDSIEILVNDNGSFKPHLHHGHRHRHRNGREKKKFKVEKTSLFIVLGVFIHNFPEGMATFIGTLTEIKLGLLLTLAIALHNIPEGIAVSIPLFIKNGSKRNAFKWSFISGISEPVGAMVTWLILFPFITPALLSALLGVVGGIMIYISLDELLPASRKLGKEHHSILGIITGMIIMAFSLALF